MILTLILILVGLERIGRRRAAKGECDLAFDDLAAHADGILAIVLPPRRPDDPAFRERLGALARLFGDVDTALAEYALAA